MAAVVDRWSLFRDGPLLRFDCSYKSMRGNGFLFLTIKEAGNVEILFQRVGISKSENLWEMSRSELATATLKNTFHRLTMTNGR
jgi:hypothetical protein